MPRYSRFVKAALEYNSVGLKVIPVHRHSKAPATPNGLDDASDDKDQIIQWFKRDKYNIAIVTGPIVVIDVDAGDHKVGPTTFATEVAHLLPQHNFHVRTGGGGSHYYFRVPAGISYRNRVSKWPDIDIKGDRGYIIAPPSVHPTTGREYQILSGSLDDIPPVPTKLHQALDHGAVTPFNKRFDYIPPSNEIPSEELLEAMRKDRSFAQLLAGQSLAPKGKRDHTLFLLCGRLAALDNFSTHPRGLAQLFIPSLKVWADKPSADTTLDQWLYLTVDKLTRQQKQLAAEDAELAPIRKLMEPEVFADGGPLLVKKGTGLVFYNFNRSEYASPVHCGDWITQAKVCWPDSCPVDMQYLNERGRIANKTLDQLLREYGAQADHIAYTYGKTGWDPETRTVKVCDARFRELKPEASREVDTWLRNMLGDNYEKAADWLACVPALDKQLCALYLSGPGGIGKTILKEGIGQLWQHEGGVAAEQCFTKFNDMLLRTPLVYLDEGWTSSTEVDLCMNIRELVGGRTHRIEIKNLPKMSLKGYPRVFISANDDLALTSNKTKPLTKEAYQATCERILYLKLNPEKDFRELGYDADKWLEEYTIPKYIWALYEQRYQILAERHEANRFIVMGEPTRFHKRLGTSFEATYAVLQWLLVAIPKNGIQALKEYFEVTDDHIAANVRAITSTWRQFELYDQFPRMPKIQDMEAVLASLSTGETVKVGLGNAFVLDPEFLIEEMERLRLCTRSDFIALIRRIAIKEVK